jgi:hypothetical protein
VSLFDVAGLAGVALMLGAYAAAQLRWLDPLKPPALLINLTGAALVMLSLTNRFNLAAFVMEAAWALVALFSLLRLAFTRRRGR